MPGFGRQWVAEQLSALDPTTSLPRALDVGLRLRAATREPALAA